MATKFSLIHIIALVAAFLPGSLIRMSHRTFGIASMGALPLSAQSTGNPLKARVLVHAVTVLTTPLPAEKARIELISNTLKTACTASMDGDCEFRDVPYGKYTLQAEYSGGRSFLPAKREINVARPQEWFTVSLLMIPQGIEPPWTIHVTGRVNSPLPSPSWVRFTGLYMTDIVEARLEGVSFETWLTPGRYSVAVLSADKVCANEVLDVVVPAQPIQVAINSQCRK